MEAFLTSFFRSDYMPHGHCYLWQPGILWTHVLSDLLIAAAYFSIPVILILLLRKHKELEFRAIFVLFAAFILCCGVTHLLSIYTIWHGTYGLHGLSKAVTAIVSFFTAVTLYRLLPQLLQLPSPKQLEEAQEKAKSEEVKRSRLEVEKKAEDIFKFAIELLPTGLLVIDQNQYVSVANRALEKMFGYGEDGLIGLPLSCLLPSAQAGHHGQWVGSYMDSPSQRHAMASGRLVRGERKDGSSVALEISLSVHELDGEKHAFASVVDVGKVHDEKGDFLESSNRLHRAIEATNDGIWEWNLQTDEVWYSNRLMQMIGRDASKDKPDLNHWSAHIHEDDSAAVQQLLQRHFEQRAKYDIVYRGLSEFGDYQWMHARGDTIFDDDGKPLLMSGTLTNIHELKRLEIELEEKTNFLDMVLNKSLSGLYIFDLMSSKNIFINEQYSKILGYTLEDLVDREGFEEIVHPEDLPLLYQHLDSLKLAEDDEKLAIEYRFKHKQGHWVWCLSQESVYSRDDDGIATQILGTFVDVTPVKEREARITQLAKDFLTTFEQAAVGIAHVALDGSWLKVNNKICEILHYRREQLLTLNFQQITYSEDLEKDLLHVEKLINGESDHYAIEKRYVRGDNQVVWTYLTVAIVRNDDGSNSHFISVIEDISERKAVEQALEESNKALERFAYSASHDMQEPLRKITAFSDSLQSKLSKHPLDSESSYELDRINDAAMRMRSMIKSLLELSRYSRQKITKEHYKLSDLVRLIEDDLSHLIEENQAQIELFNDVTLFVDIHSFQQLLVNLVTNAIRYRQADTNPIIQVSSEKTIDSVRVIMKDNGIGFDNQFNKAIFEPFQRLRERGKSGHGMGLAICDLIVRAHGGTITAMSEPGKGASFTIQVPINE